MPGWKIDGRDIGWLESLAVELAASWFASQVILDADLLVHWDKTSVIDGYRKGRSRNESRNASIRRISSILMPNNLTITPVYVPSAMNLADPFSRGVLESHNDYLPVQPLAEELCPFLVECTGQYRCMLDNVHVQPISIMG
jgi:hypothetical protein